MSNGYQAPPMGFKHQPPPSAPPSYFQAVGGVPPCSPYTPQQPPGVTTQPLIVTTVVPLGPNNTHMICHHCQNEINTKTTKTPSFKAYVSGFILCFIGLFCGCCLIPCCMNSCMDVKHTCPACNQYLGTYKC